MGTHLRHKHVSYHPWKRLWMDRHAGRGMGIVESWLTESVPVPSEEAFAPGMARSTNPLHTLMDYMKAEPSLLRAALVGYESRLAQLNNAIEEVRHALTRSDGTDTSPAAKPANSAPSDRRISAAGRARIAAAQKRRWEAYRKKKR